jgi:hypothetical protein
MWVFMGRGREMSLVGDGIGDDVMTLWRFELLDVASRVFCRLRALATSALHIPFFPCFGLQYTNMYAMAGLRHKDTA